MVVQVTLDMAEKRVETVRDFNWESQMRYSWEWHEQPPSGAHPQVGPGGSGGTLGGADWVIGHSGEQTG